jgi:hypothetical protein
MCNTCCFSTATMVARTRLTIRIYVHCVPCLTYCHHKQHTLVTHADGVLCLEMYTVGSRSSPPVLKCSFDTSPSDELLSNSICVVHWRSWDVQHPPPPRSKFPSFDKAEPNSQFREKYIRNNLIRIRVSLIYKLSATPD